MHHFLWFVHIFGVALWLGVSAKLLVVWPSRASLQASLEESSNRRLDLRTLITLHIRTGLPPLAHPDRVTPLHLPPHGCL